jgi:hypothetical protein
MNKIRVYDTYNQIDPSDSFEYIIKLLQSAIAAEEKGEWENLMIETSDYDSCDRSWHIYGMRWETDKEREKRAKELEKHKKFKDELKKSKQERERKEYERLKKKFEDK